MRSSSRQITPFATFQPSGLQVTTGARSSRNARDFHHVRCSERSYLFTMSDILQISTGCILRTGAISRVSIQPLGCTANAQLSFRGRESLGHESARSRAGSHEQARVEQLSDEQNPNWWSQTGSNRRPPACKAGALPTELWPLKLVARD